MDNDRRRGGISPPPDMQMDAYFQTGGEETSPLRPNFISRVFFKFLVQLLSPYSRLTVADIFIIHLDQGHNLHACIGQKRLVRIVQMLRGIPSLPDLKFAGFAGQV